MKRSIQLSVLFAILFTLLLAANPVMAHPRTSPCTAATDRSAMADCSQFRAYLRGQTETWNGAAVPESTMRVTRPRYVPNWDAIADIAYIPESTMVTPLSE